MNIRPGTLRAYAFGVITGSIVTASLAVWTTPAKADTGTDYAVCSVLEQYPSIQGIIGIGLALKDEGYSGYEAGEVIGTAVINECPQFIPLMMRFAEMYAPEATGEVA